VVRFLSLEPLLGPLRGLPLLTDIDWVIVGAERGPSCRPVSMEWVREIRDQRRAARVPFFFKQWGGRTPKAGGPPGLVDDRPWHRGPSLPFRAAKGQSAPRRGDRHLRAEEEQPDMRNDRRTLFALN
jgi:protein gp37